MEFLDPKNDIAFKKIFGDKHHKNLTINFLNNVLNLSGIQEIQDLSFKETTKLPDRLTGKKVHFDIYCIDKGRNEYIIEMQSLNEYNFVPRSEFYIARALMQQLNKGKDYQKLLPVIFVGIVNFALFDELDENNQGVFKNKEVMSHYSMRNDLTGELLKGSRQKLHYIELPKFNKTLDQLKTDADKWFYFLKHADSLEDIPKPLQSLHEAFDILDALQWSDLDLQEYTVEQEEAEKQRRQQEGSYLKGMNDGRREALQEGEHAKAEKIATKLLKQGKSFDEISELTDLSPVEIERLKNKLK